MFAFIELSLCFYLFFYYDRDDDFWFNPKKKKKCVREGEEGKKNFYLEFWIIEDFLIKKIVIEIERNDLVKNNHKNDL